MHRQRRFPARAIGTAIAGAEFVGLAHGFGTFAERIETSATFPDAFGRARRGRATDRIGPVPRSDANISRNGA